MPSRVPFWLKIAYTAFVLLLIPLYWDHYGPVNFLWFSNIALLTTAVALWTEDALLASMMAVSVVLPEVVWNLGFFIRLFTGEELFGLSGYMFDDANPRFIRALSLYHVPLPFLLLWLLHRLGYDRRAPKFQTLLAWIILPLCFFLTDASGNENWVYGPGETGQSWMPAWLWLALLMVAFPLLIYWPAHLLFKRNFSPPPPSR